MDFPGLMLTVCSYVVNWKVVYVSHVANSWEDHKASKDTRESVSKCDD